MVCTQKRARFGLEVPVALFNAAGPLVPGNEDADMVGRARLQAATDFLLRFVG
jgi:hypothetical protein